MSYKVGQVITVKNVDYEIIAITVFDDNSSYVTELNKSAELHLVRTHNARRIMKLFVSNDGELYSNLNHGSCPIKYKSRYISEFGNSDEITFAESGNDNPMLLGEEIQHLAIDPRNWNSYDEPNRNELINMYRRLNNIKLEGNSTLWSAALTHAVYLAIKKGAIQVSSTRTTTRTVQRQSNKFNKVFGRSTNGI